MKVEGFKLVPADPSPMDTLRRIRDRLLAKTDWTPTEAEVYKLVMEQLGKRN